MSVDPETTAQQDAGLVPRLLHGFAPLVALTAGLVWVVRRTASNIVNDDTYFHLRFGDGFLHGWSLWGADSPTRFGTRDWVPTQWLPQVIMSWLEGVAGLAAVSWLYGVALLAYLLVLYAVTRREAPAFVASVVTLIALIASGPGLSARPQVFSFILVAVFTSAWLATWRDGRVRWWLIPLTWLWTMVHGMWIVGVVISLVAAVGLLADRPSDPRRRLRPLLVPAGSLLVALLTPVGPRLVAETLVVGSRGDYFAEWAPPDFTQPLALALLMLLLAPLVIWLRQGQIAWTPILLLVLAGGWAVYTLRTGPVAAAMAAPLAAHALASVVPDRRIGVKERGFLWVAVPLALALVVVLAPREPQATERPTWEPELLSSLPAGTGVLNEWGSGGYLMWRYPHLDIVISGYGDIYTDDELDRNIHLRRTEAGWVEELGDLEVEVAYLDPDSDLAYALRDVLGWQVVRGDDDAVFLRRPSSTPE